MKLDRFFPHSPRFARYDLSYLDPDVVTRVDGIVGAFMLVRAEAIVGAGLLDETFLMYGEDLDWAKRITDAGWEVWYNPQVTVLHIKEAASRHSYRARVEFFRAMILFYEKHYKATTPFYLDWAIRGGVWLFGGLDLLGRRLRGQYRSFGPTGRRQRRTELDGMRRSRILFVVSLVLTDAAMSLLAFFIGYLIRLWAHGPEIGRSDYLLLAGIQLVNTLVVFFFFKFYHRRHAALLMDEVYRLFGAVSVATLLTIAFVWFVFRDTLQIQRLMLLLAWAVGIITLTLGRIAHGRVQRVLQRRGIGAERVLIIGTGEVGRMIVQKIQHTPGLGYRVAGFVETSFEGETPPAQVMGLPVFGGVDNLPKIIESQGIDEVIIGLPEATHQELVGIVSQCEREKVSIRVFPDVFQIMASEVTISDLGGLPLLTIRDVALRGWKLTLKRIVDMAFSGTFLLVASPFMMLTALLIKVDSSGPVFFAQERMGLDAKPFKMLKFRSMRADAERNGPGWTTKDDPRRTGSALSSARPRWMSCRSSSTC